uniref:Uncharacterized protein n=1 Tax=Peronospora matthiolae TaxID=2874970 RepID=A0AAV1T0H9_9STRA
MVSAWLQKVASRSHKYEIVAIVRRTSSAETLGTKPVTPTAGADLSRDSLAAGMSDLDASGAAGGVGSGNGSEERSDNSAAVERAYHPRSGDLDGESRDGDEGLVGCRSGDPVGIVGDPVGLRWRGDPGRSGTAGVCPPRSGDPGDMSRSGDRNMVGPSDEISEGAVVAKSLRKFCTRIGGHTFKAPLTGGKGGHETRRSNTEVEDDLNGIGEPIQLSLD